MVKIASIKMYYENLEESQQNRFFPFLSTNENSKAQEVDIDFELLIYNNELLWAQKTENIITCLEPECGAELLKIMNDAYCINAVKILNKVGNLLYPKKEKVD
jgi:hypothetical protein